MGQAPPFFISKDQAFLPFSLSSWVGLLPFFKGLAPYYILNLNIEQQDSSHNN